MQSIDYIIIGQGLAGSMLSYFLLKEGKRVLVVDPGGSNASRVAPGMFNPLTGRRMSKSWRIDEALPFAFETYRQLEDELQSSFFHPLPMYRFFANENEREATRRKIAEEQAEKYIEDYFDEMRLEGFCKPLTNGCTVTQTGYLDTQNFLDSDRYWLHRRGSLNENSLSYDEIKIGESSVRWQDIEAEKIIFCEGYRGAQNPWFKSLPWNLAKGEVLTFNAPELKLDKLYNRNLYIVPVGNGYFRAGATYNWDDLTETPTKAGRQELIDKLDQIICTPYEITDYKAGVRPTIVNRRPLIGLHPENPQMGIFNGLGTKGVMLSPYLGKHFADYLTKGTELFPEADVKLRLESK
jgi:glycine/D-amino acid oxidase-like deaminating enzyme